MSSLVPASQRAGDAPDGKSATKSSSPRRFGNAPCPLTRGIFNHKKRLMNMLNASAREGLRRALPIVLGYAPVGFAYGVLAVQTGLHPVFAVILSVVLYAGSGQFVLVNMWGAGFGMASIIITVMIVNLRHLLMSAALSPHLVFLGRLQKALFAHELTDETFAVHIAAFSRGQATDATTLFACNLTAHFSWVAVSSLGAMFGSLLRDVRPYGLDYALPAMFLALLVPMCVKRLHVVLAILAAGSSVLFKLAGLNQWNVILASVLAATFGTYIAYRTRRPS